jgi:Mg2+ and Co2+ transporter CorA
MRPVSEIGSELNSRIADFESTSGVEVDDLLREEIGAGDWLALGESPSNYSHPVARIEQHGELVLMTLAVPASLHNGLADFTNVLMLAHKRALLSIIRDPKGTFAADFGGRLRADYELHTSNEQTFSADEAVFRALRSCVLSLETSLNTLRAAVERSFKDLRAIELREGKKGHDLDILEAEFGKTLSELRAMTRTPGHLRGICENINLWAADGTVSGMFSKELVRQVTFLSAKISQVEAKMGTFISDIERAIKRCDDVSKRQMLDAQRRNTYWTSALLLPNLIFAFFGQSFLGNAREGSQFWWVSGVALVIYGIGSTSFFLSRNWRGE